MARIDDLNQLVAVLNAHVVTLFKQLETVDKAHLETSRAMTDLRREHEKQLALLQREVAFSRGVFCVESVGWHLVAVKFAVTRAPLRVAAKRTTSRCDLRHAISYHSPTYRTSESIPRCESGTRE